MNEPPIDEPPPKPKTTVNETLKRIENMMERNHMCLLFVLTTVATVGVVMGLASLGAPPHSSTI